MIDYSQEASFYRSALLLGLTTGDAVIAWADNIIANDAEAAEKFLDLSMIPSHDLSELRHALEPISAREDSVAMLRALFDIARRDLENGRRSAADTVTVVAQARSFLKLPMEISREVDQFAKDHMLAGAGIIHDKNDVETRLRAWLAQFENAEHEFLETARC